MIITPPTVPFVTPTTMIDVIRMLGQESSLQFCVDAGDKLSYPGSGQNITDRSGNTGATVLGLTGSVEAGEPTFVGVAGRQSSSEYFDMGTDSTKSLLTAPITTWMNTMHKDNAVFSIAVWQYNTGDGPNETSIVFTGSGTDAGIQFGIGGAAFGVNDLLYLLKYVDGGGSYETISANGPTASYGSWQFYGLSYTESSGALVMQVNTTQASATKSYSVSSTSDLAATGLTLAAGSLAFAGWLNAAAVWTRALSSAELLALFNATRTKFGV